MPHTGTVFTRYVLGRFALRDKRECPVGEYMSYHTNDLEAGLRVGDDERVVVPLRDPMLAEISRVNRGWGMPVSHWDLLLPVLERERTHVLRVQLPPGVLVADEVEALAEFLGRSVPDLVEWTPKNAQPGDPDRLKWKYSRGKIDNRLRPAFDWLSDHPTLSGVFRSHGYDLEWM